MRLNSRKNRANTNLGLTFTMENCSMGKKLNLVAYRAKMATFLWGILKMI